MRRRGGADEEAGDLLDRLLRRRQADAQQRRARPPAAAARGVSARCAPRRVPITAWISSTMTVRTVRSISRLRSAVSSRYSDSGVVTRMCGGVRSIAARSACGVSPVRTAAVIRGGSRPMLLRDRGGCRGAARRGSCGCRRSAPSAARRRRRALRRAAAPRSPSCSRSSSAVRNAASVLPDPVGAAISVWRPSRIDAQPRCWAAVGSPSASANQRAVAGWNGVAAERPGADGISHRNLRLCVLGGGSGSQGYGLFC